MPELRDQVREYVLALAETDARVVAAAEVGSLALGEGDRWSDLDLTFGLADGTPVADVLEDWTRELAESFDAVVLLDLDRGDLQYRVFLIRDSLQVDLSFAAGAARQTSPAFRLLFGDHTRELASPPSALELLGWGVIFARHTRVCLARGRRWQAEYCIGAVRDHALTLACLRRDLPTAYGKGFDRLPPDILEHAEGALVHALDAEELLRALGVAVEALLREGMGVSDLVERVERPLRELTEPLE